MTFMPQKPNRGYTPTINVHILPPAIWLHEEVDFRSHELTPLYIDRYDGPRTNCALSAHDHWELTYVFKGRGILRTEKDIALPQSSAILIPPKTLHTELANDRIDTLWVGLAGTKLTLLNNRDIYVVNGAELHALFEKLWGKTEKLYGLVGPELDGIVTTLFGKILQLTTAATARNQDAVDFAVEYMKKNYAHLFSIATLAEKLGYSEGYFYRTFKRRTGQTPNHFLSIQRIQHASRMLEHTSLSIKKIATQSGFRDPLYFSKVFQKLTGKSPTQYRHH